MNTAMLKCLAELANYEVDVIAPEAFFTRYPRDISTNELYSLKNLGFVSLVTSEDQISEIGVNKKAIDYLKKISS